MAELKDISKTQVLYDALMIVTDGKKYQIRDICDSLVSSADYKFSMGTGISTSEVGAICDEINSHLIEQGY